MKVDIKITEEGITEPHAVIYASALTDEVQRAVANLTAQESTIPAVSEERIFMLKPEDIYMARVENNQLSGAVAFQSPCWNKGSRGNGTDEIQ